MPSTVRASRALREQIRLRSYQLPAFADLTRAYEAYLKGGSAALGYEAPMGSGKTTTVRATAAWLLDDERARLVVVAAPLSGIVEQWRSPAFFKEPPIVCDFPTQFPARLPARSQEWRKVDVVPASQLRDPSWWATATGFFVCTRQAMCTRASVDAMRAATCDLRRVLAVGDEGHHHGDGTHAGAFFEALRARGAATLLVSGTPWHGTGSIFTADTFVARLSAAKLATEINPDTGCPFVPTQWRTAKHVVGWTTNRAEYAVESDTADDTGVRWASGYVAIMCRAVADEWARLGCPRTVVNVPGAAAWGKRLADEMRRAGTPVLGRAPVGVDLIGNMKDADRAAAQARLRVDGEARTWDHPARVDYVASCARMDEGTDWPPCSHVFNVRIPRSPLRVLQRWARASRGKHEIVGYPEQWRDTQTMVFFVPSLEGEAIEEAWRQHREHSILLAAYLADYEEARRWVQPEPARASEWKHRAARSKKLGERLGPGDLPSSGRDDLRGGSSLDRARVVADLVQRIAKTKGGAAKVADLDAALAAALPDVPHAARKAALLQLARGKDVEAAVTAARERATKAMAAGKPLVDVRVDLAADLTRIVEEFAHLEIRVPDELMACVVQFTALDAVAVSERMRGTNDSSWRSLGLPDAQTLILRECAIFREKTGHYPKSNDRVMGVLVSGIAAWLVAKGSQPLSQLMQPDWYDENMFISSVRRLGADYKQTTGKYPSNKTGYCPHFDTLWSGVDQRSKQLLGHGIADIFSKNRTSDEEAANIVSEWLTKHGYPRQRSGDENERRASHLLVRLQRKPDFCVKMNIPLAHEKSEAQKRRSQGVVKARGCKQYPSYAVLAVELACNWRVCADDKGRGSLAQALKWAFRREKPMCTRGLFYAKDGCQVSGFASANAEIEADCWRFMLDGANAPDQRPWAELLTSGDHKRIVSAERVAFLDWQDVRLRSGTRWTNTVPKSNVPDAIRRPLDRQHIVRILRTTCHPSI